METDRNLLFGVLALRAGLVDSEQFAAACDRWARQPKQPLADLLLGPNGLDHGDRAHLDYLLDRQLHRNGGSATAALAALADANVRSALGGVRDSGLRDWLANALPGGLWLEPSARTGRGWKTWVILGAVVLLFLLLGGGAAVVVVGVMASRERIMADMARAQAEMAARLEAEAANQLDREMLDRVLRTVAGPGDDPESMQVREKFLLELLAAHQDRRDKSKSTDSSQRAIADLQEQLAEHYWKAKQLDKAEAMFRQACGSYSLRLNGIRQPSMRGRDNRDIARCQARLGTLLRERGNLKEAEEAFRQAFASHQSMPYDSSVNYAQQQQEAAAAQLQLARAIKDNGNDQQAETQCNQAVMTLSSLSQQYPQNSACRLELGRGYLLLGILQRKDGRVADAETAFGNAVTHLEQVVQGQPKDAAPPPPELMTAYEALADLLKAPGKEKELKTVTQKMKRLQEKKESDKQ